MEELAGFLTIDGGTQATVGKAHGLLSRTAASDGGIRVLYLDHEGVTLRDDAEAGDELAVGEFLGLRSGEADINMEVGVLVLHEAVPATVDSRPVDSLAAEALHVRLTA